MSKKPLGPGPAAYNIPSTFGKGPQYSFGRRTKLLGKRMSESPGPGLYGIYGLTRVGRRPGPGTYNIPSVFGFEGHDVRLRRNPQFTFGHRVRERPNTVPGPGSYHLYNLTSNGVVTKKGHYYNGDKWR